MFVRFTIKEVLYNIVYKKRCIYYGYEKFLTIKFVCYMYVCAFCFIRCICLKSNLRNLKEVMERKPNHHYKAVSSIDIDKLLHLHNSPFT